MKFTKENAREMSARANVARWSRFRDRKRGIVANGRTSAGIPEDERRNCLGEQIAILDKRIAKEKKADVLCKLIAAKAKLWNLLYPPETGKKTRDRAGGQTMAPIAPLPIVNPPALVAPLDQANHNGEIAG